MQCSMGSAQATLPVRCDAVECLVESSCEVCAGVAVVPDGRVGRYVQACET